MSWSVRTRDDGDHVDILPLLDLVVHEEDDDCVCGVTQQPCGRPDGTIGWMRVHHSADGREARE